VQRNLHGAFETIAAEPFTQQLPDLSRSTRADAAQEGDGSRRPEFAKDILWLGLLFGCFQRALPQTQVRTRGHHE
jgi:hypothetical protein